MKTELFKKEEVVQWIRNDLYMLQIKILSLFEDRYEDKKKISEEFDKFASFFIDLVSHIPSDVPSSPPKAEGVKDPEPSEKD